MLLYFKALCILTGVLKTARKVTIPTASAIEQLPKVELHCHIDGILDPLMLEDMERARVPYPITSRKLRSIYPNYGIDGFMRWFELVDTSFHQSFESFKPILERHVERLKAQNVVYAEIYVGAIELPPDDTDFLKNLEATRRYLGGLEERRIQIELVYQFGRNRRPERLYHLSDWIIRAYREELVVGVVMAGMERDYPVKPFQRVLGKFKEAGLGIEIHAGEWVGPESVRDALDHGSPDRIGHGVTAFQDAELLAQIREEGVHIEMCPTSNVLTGSVKSIKDHPIQKARDLNMNFSINTDDPGIFECSMNSEYQLLVDEFGFTADDFARIYENSLHARFQRRLRYL